MEEYSQTGEYFLNIFDIFFLLFTSHSFKVLLSYTLFSFDSVSNTTELIKKVLYSLLLLSRDLFFRQIATANSSTPQLPVTVQIRPLVNGLPSTGTILPFGETSLKPESINATTAAPEASNTSHYTTFEFPAPVYLTGDEYALVIISNSSEYQLWTAVQGLNPLSTAAISPTFRIPKQPNVEDLFLPTNAGNANMSPGEALMFRVNRCHFTTTNQGNIILMSNSTSQSAATSNAVSYTHLTLPTILLV